LDGPITAAISMLFTWQYPGVVSVVLGGIVVDDYDMMMIKTLIKSGQRQHLVQLSMVVSFQLNWTSGCLWNQCKLPGQEFVDLEAYL
jgi:hypothetical protein